MEAEIQEPKVTLYERYDSFMSKLDKMMGWIFRTWGPIFGWPHTLFQLHTKENGLERKIDWEHRWYNRTMGLRISTALLCIPVAIICLAWYAVAVAISAVFLVLAIVIWGILTFIGYILNDEDYVAPEESEDD